jgi:ribosome-associated protein
MAVPQEAQPTIQLAQFLKLLGWVGTGGEAKQLIQRGDVRVNGAIETRRGRQLQPGDVVQLAGRRQAVPDELSEG